MILVPGRFFTPFGDASTSVHAVTSSACSRYQRTGSAVSSRQPAIGPPPFATVTTFGVGAS